MDSVAERLARVRARIANAAAQAGREASGIRLIAASKTRSSGLIREAYAAGQRDFGENYVQELVEKAEALADLPDLRWHMIGHLQSNKARLVVRVASAVHTVHSSKLARELGRRAADSSIAGARRFVPAGRNGDARLVVLVEVNVGGEAQKSGCSPDQLGAVLDVVDAEPALALSGLMSVPPQTADPAGARPFFDELARLRDAHGGAARLPELSIGMTHDLEQAVMAGSTIVRVGTALFGARS